MNRYTTTASVGFHGNSSELHSYCNPPLKLDPDRQYQIALVALSTYHSIPNIYEGFNRFYYGDEGKYVEIPTGSYEISAIGDLLTTSLGSENIKLTANNNTLRCELVSVYDIDFTPGDSIGSLLGFSAKKFPRSELHLSDIPVNINKVSSINVLCNIVSGSYLNGSEQHILHSFYPQVPPGHKIDESPVNLIYLPVNRTDVIDSVSVRLVDQNNTLINFRQEEIFIRAHIKQWG